MENKLRQDIAQLIDDAFDAYVQATGSIEGYTRNQFYLNLLFQSVNAMPIGSLERIGGLQLIVMFMRRLVEHYKTHIEPEDERDGRYAQGE